MYILTNGIIVQVDGLLENHAIVIKEKWIEAIIPQDQVDNYQG